MTRKDILDVLGKRISELKERNNKLRARARSRKSRHFKELQDNKKKLEEIQEIIKRINKV